MTWVELEIQQPRQQWIAGGRLCLTGEQAVPGGVGEVFICLFCFCFVLLFFNFGGEVIRREDGYGRTGEMVALGCLM